MKKLRKSFGHALDGIKYVFKNEGNFRIQVLLAVGVCVVGYFLDWAPWKWAVTFVLFAMVLSLESVNSAVEYMWDHVEPNHHPVVGIVKDVMAGAVLIGAVGSVAVALVLFFF